MPQDKMITNMDAIQREKYSSEKENLQIRKTEESNERCERNRDEVGSSSVFDDVKDHVESLENTSKNNTMRAIAYPVIAVGNFCSKHKKYIYWFIGTLIAIGLTAYMGVAIDRNFSRAVPFLVIWCLVVGYNIYAFIRDQFGYKIVKICEPAIAFFARNRKWLKWIFVIGLIAGLGVWIGLDTIKRPNQLISGAGYLVLLFVLFLTSKHPDRVSWRPVLFGLLIQIALAIIVLRTSFGFDAFNWLGNFALTFINFIDAGVEFVFGPSYRDHEFAFRVLPIIIYISAFISILYYFGAMQWLILKIGWLMQFSLGTTAPESTAVAGSIFIGGMESALLIRPYFEDLTVSEIHAVMMSGFATISGSVLGAYLGFGIQAVYVITSCVISAPCTLAVSKLVYPETKKSKFTSDEGLTLEKSEQRNITEAAFVGASQSIPLVLCVGANLIAFLSLLAAVNGFLAWFGGLLDFSQLSFELMCSYVLMPVTYLMGIEWTFCLKAAELMGTKIFLNEFVAYELLGEMIEKRDNGTIPMRDPVTGKLNWVDERTEAIITYALCDFANVGSIGIMLGTVGILAPKRQGEMAKIVVRSLVAGIFVSILNACVAGFLYDPVPIICDNMLATTNWTYTEPSRLYQCCAPLVDSLSLNSSLASECCSYPWNMTDYELDCKRFEVYKV